MVSRMARRWTRSSLAGRCAVAAIPRASISACEGTRSGRHGVLRHRMVHRLRRQLHRRQHELRAGRAVDRAVVGLGVDGELASLVEPLDEVHLPQRSRAVEGSRRDARHDLLQLAVGPGRGDGDGALVELTVEAWILDPVRVVQAEGHLDEPAPSVGRQAVEVLRVGRLLLRRAPVWRLRLTEDLQAADVPVVGGRLHVEERRIKSRQLLHCTPQVCLADDANRAARPPRSARHPARLSGPRRVGARWCVVGRQARGSGWRRSRSGCAGCRGTWRRVVRRRSRVGRRCSGRRRPAG